jgi:hypothetical protein
MNFFLWVGGSVGRMAGTGLATGVVMIIFGMTPSELVVRMVAEMPDWVFGGWFRLGLVVVGLFVIWGSLRFNIWSRRQQAIDCLSDKLAHAVHNILNKPVKNEVDLGAFISDFEKWEGEVLGIIDKFPAYFSKSDRTHFEVLGAVNVTPWGFAYRAHDGDERHNKQLCMLSMKFDRLRDIINWAQQRTR